MTNAALIEELEKLHTQLNESEQRLDLDISSIADDISLKAQSSNLSIDSIALRNLKSRYMRWLKLREWKAPSEIIDWEYHWLARLVEELICHLKGAPFVLTKEEIEDLELQAVIFDDD